MYNPTQIPAREKTIQSWEEQRVTKTYEKYTREYIGEIYNYVVIFVLRLCMISFWATATPCFLLGILLWVDCPRIIWLVKGFKIGSLGKGGSKIHQFGTDEDMLTVYLQFAFLHIRDNIIVSCRWASDESGNGDSWGIRSLPNRD